MLTIILSYCVVDRMFVSLRTIASVVASSALLLWRQRHEPTPGSASETPVNQFSCVFAWWPNGFG